MTAESIGAADDLASPAMIEDSLRRLRAWLEGEGYAGIEPHDALTSPILQRTPLGRSRFIRLAALQGLRRLPVDIRRLLGVRKQINPVSLGWVLKAYAVIDDPGAREQVAWALGELERTRAHGYSGACWGYYFDWQTRAAFKPAHLPIIVSTAFIGDGLMDVYERYGRRECLDRARSACDFILDDLNRTPGRPLGKRGFCFSYSPEDHQQVFNASMLGAGLLTRVGAATAEPRLIDAAREAVEFVVDHQREDGSWAYGIGEHWSFVDNFHTGYVLVSLKEYMRHSGDERHAGALERGWKFYRDRFLLDGRIPKYYHDRAMPIDAHAAAQTIVTLLELGDREGALRVAKWTIENMQARNGYFIYQIHRRFRNRIPYLRWANAWMLYPLARLSST
jgi:hypothetical protein